MANRKHIIDRLSEDRRNELVNATRAAAVAIAELWDVLRGIEQAHKIMLEYSDDMLNSLAGDCSTPASFSDLTNETLLTALREEFAAKTKETKKARRQRLLDRARELQTNFWDALSELEVAMGFELEGNMDLPGDPSELEVYRP